MSVLERAEKGFNWLEHGKTMMEILIALGLGRIVDAALATWTHVSPPWRTPIWLLSAALFLLAIMKVWPRAMAAQGQSTKQSNALVKGIVDLQPIRDGYKSLDHRIVQEAETEIGKSLANIQGQEREKLLIELVVTLLWGLTFFNTWRLVYGSQVRALMELNRRQLTRQEMHPFYAEVALKHPDIYVTYDFEQWLGFMRTAVLLREQNDRIAITVRGQAFLKFLLDLSVSDKDKSY